MDRQQRPRKPDPMFLGVPSPSLSKMRRMSVTLLQQQIERLTMEGKRLLEKAERLKTITPCPEERIAQLGKQKLRLDALAKVAQTELTQRQQQGPSDRGGSRGHRSGGYGGHRSGSSGYGGGHRDSGRGYGSKPSAPPSGSSYRPPTSPAAPLSNPTTPATPPSTSGDQAGSSSSTPNA